MAVRASRTSSSLNGLMIAITIFMGLSPRLGPVQTDRAFSTEIHHAEKVTTRAQPGPIESNAVPDRRKLLTVYESGPFRPLREERQAAPFGRAQSEGRPAQTLSMPDFGHHPAQRQGRRMFQRKWNFYCNASPCCEISRPSSSCCSDTRSGTNALTSLSST